jgi:hypothetical protein
MIEGLHLPVASPAFVLGMTLARDAVTLENFRPVPSWRGMVETELLEAQYGQDDGALIAIRHRDEARFRWSAGRRTPLPALFAKAWELVASITSPVGAHLRRERSRRSIPRRCGSA